MKKHSACLLIGCMLSACMVGPNYQKPHGQVPANWHSPPPTASNPIKPTNDQWWRSFKDPVLDRLIDDAIAANLDLKQALLRIQQARVQYSATIAAGLPSLSSHGNVSRRFNNTAGSNQGGSSAGSGFGIGNQLINIYQFGFDAQWELDFFGGERRAMQAAQAAYEAEIENSRAILLSLLGEVARYYVTLRLNQQIWLNQEQHLALLKESLDLGRVRLAAGLVNELELSQLSAQIKALEADLPGIQNAIAESIHAIGMLLSRSPGSLFARLEIPAAQPQSDFNQVLNLPSELLLRRPDIRFAERRMAAANAQIGVATSELYPKINLAAFIGLQNLNISGFTPVGKSWSTAGTLTVPLFNWGKLNANLKGKRLEFEQSFLEYQETVLTAFKEVEDTLSACHKEQARRKSLEEALSVRQLAHKLAQERYQKGLENFISVLNEAIAIKQAEQEILNSRAQLAQLQIALFKALGGGWQELPQVNPAAPLKARLY